MTHVALMVASASIIALLGTAHLIMTYRGAGLRPRDRDLPAEMDRAHLAITTQTTIRRAWLGFNVSHSLGCITFGLVYAYLALAGPEVLFGSPVLLGIGLTVQIAYVALAKR